MKLRNLFVLLVFLLMACAALYAEAAPGPHRLYREMVEAAERMEKCTDAIRAERLARGLSLSDEDYLGIGLLGEPSTSITTTTGAVAAKRTSQLPVMAAMCVRLLDEAGLSSGDVIGACFSGSFPGLNVALVCAADALGMQIRYISSIGASSYGANLPTFTAPEILLCLYEKGLISSPPLMATPGGDADMGLNMLGIVLEDEPDLIQSIRSRIETAGVPFIIEPDYEKNLQLRRSCYGDIDCFVNVGGNVAGMGRDGNGYLLGQGVLHSSGYPLTEQSGLLEIYLQEGLPAIQLLNLKQLCAEYSIPFDPSVKPAIGEGAPYEIRSVSKVGIAVVFMTAFLGLWLVGSSKRSRAGRRKSGGICN